MYIIYRSWWRHDMEALSPSLAFCEGNPPVTGGLPVSPVDSSCKGPVVQSFDVFAVISSKLLNKLLSYSDLRHHSAHVMSFLCIALWNLADKSLMITNWEVTLTYTDLWRMPRWVKKFFFSHYLHTMLKCLERKMGKPQGTIFHP